MCRGPEESGPDLLSQLFLDLREDAAHNVLLRFAGGVGNSPNRGLTITDDSNDLATVFGSL